MKKNPQNGFTLIELLVVVAIIGILASIVLSSLSTARLKGADAKIKAELANARAQGQVYYEANNSTYYTDATENFCTSQEGAFNILSSLSTLTTGAIVVNGSQDETNVHCNVYNDGWMIQVPLKQPDQVASGSGVDYWCVDSGGASKPEEQPAVGWVEDTDVDPPTGTPISCL